MQWGKERTENLTMVLSLDAAEVPTFGCRGGHVISNNALNTGWCIAYACVTRRAIEPGELSGRVVDARLRLPG